MDLFKKWASCIFSFVTGFLGLILSLCSGMTNTIKVASEAIASANISTAESTEGYKILTDASLADQAQLYNASSEFACLRVFAIIMTVVSILLIIYSLVMLLKNLNVIKCDSAVFDIIGIVLGCLVVATVIGLFISSSVYANALEVAVVDMLEAQFAQVITMVTINVSVSVGVYQWIMLFVGIIAAIINTTFIVLKRKDA